MRPKFLIATTLVVIALSALGQPALADDAFDPWAYDTPVAMAEAWFACCYHAPPPLPVTEEVPAPAPWTELAPGVRRACRHYDVWVAESTTADQAVLVQTALAKINPWFDWSYAGIRKTAPSDGIFVEFSNLGTVEPGGWTSWAVDNETHRFTDSAHILLNTYDPGPSLQRAMHELGHVAGLGHVADYTQIMNTDASRNIPAEYGTGDVAGLDTIGCRSA